MMSCGTADGSTIADRPARLTGFLRRLQPLLALLLLPGLLSIIPKSPGVGRYDRLYNSKMGESIRPAEAIPLYK